MTGWGVGCMQWLGGAVNTRMKLPRSIDRGDPTQIGAEPQRAPQQANANFRYRA